MEKKRPLSTDKGVLFSGGLEGDRTLDLTVANRKLRGVEPDSLSANLLRSF